MRNIQYVNIDHVLLWCRRRGKLQFSRDDLRLVHIAFTQLDVRNDGFLNIISTVKWCPHQIDIPADIIVRESSAAWASDSVTKDTPLPMVPKI